MSEECEPLWSDDRIEAELRRIGDNMRLYIADAATVAEQVRDEYEASIAELEARLEGIEALKTQVTSLRQTINDLRIELSAYQAAHNRKLPPGFTRQRKNVPPWEDCHE